MQRPIVERPASPPEIVKNTEMIEQILQKKLSIATLPPPMRAQTAPTQVGPIPRSASSNVGKRSQDNGMSDFGALFAGGDNYFNDKKLSPQPSSLTSRIRAATTGGLNNNNGQHLLEDTEDTSQISDMRSLAFNPRSEQQISLKVSKLYHYLNFVRYCYR